MLLAMKIAFVIVMILGFLSFSAFFAWRLSNACNAQTCITRNTPIASPPSDVRYLTSSTGNRIAVWCDHVTGNLVYEDTYNGNLDVVKDGCLAS